MSNLMWTKRGYLVEHLIEVFEKTSAVAEKLQLSDATSVDKQVLIALRELRRLIIQPAGPWEHRCYGSGEDRGDHIFCNGDRLAYLGDQHHDAVARLVYEHNCAINAVQSRLVDELRSALELLVERPVRYCDNRIEIDTGSHAEAMDIVRKARAALARAEGRSDE